MATNVLRMVVSPLSQYRFVVLFSWQVYSVGPAAKELTYLTVSRPGPHAVYSEAGNQTRSGFAPRPYILRRKLKH